MCRSAGFPINGIAYKHFRSTENNPNINLIRPLFVLTISTSSFLLLLLFSVISSLITHYDGLMADYEFRVPTVILCS